MANCLLYCVRYDDTIVWTHSENPTWRIILVNIQNIPYVNSPLMHHIGGKSCEKLAFIYKKVTVSQYIQKKPIEGGNDS